MQMMLSVEMTDENYAKFLIDDTKEEKTGGFESGRFKKSDFFNLMQKIKETDDRAQREALVTSAMEMVSRLEDEKSDLQTELVSLIRKLKAF